MMTKEEHREAMMGLCIAHITSPAENRMRTRRAVEQLAQVQQETEKANSDDYREAASEHPGD